MGKRKNYYHVNFSVGKLGHRKFESSQQQCKYTEIELNPKSLCTDLSQIYSHIEICSRLVHMAKTSLNHWESNLTLQ